MSVILRLLELLSASHKLKDSKPYVMRALTGVATMILLGVFATVMAALMVAGLLWLVYAQMLEAGAGMAVASLVAVGLGVVVVVVTLFAAMRRWDAVRSDIEAVFTAQQPAVGRVADRVSGVATSFLSGLRRRRTT